MRTVVLVLVAACCACGKPQPRSGLEDADARISAAEGACSLAIAGAREIPASFPEDVYGVRMKGSGVSNLAVWRHAFDWSAVDLRGGPVRALLLQADAHRRALAAVGLVPVGAAGTGLGREREVPHSPNSVHVRRRTATGQGGYLVDLESPRIAHYRLYRGSRSAASLFVRLEYDQASRRLEVEFSYSDTTVFDRTYPEVADRLEETVDVE